VRRLLLLLPLCALAVACGSGSKTSGPYLPKPTAACLRSHGLHVSLQPPDVQLVIRTADFGGLRAWHTRAGNQLQIAFTRNERTADLEKRAIRRVAPPLLKRRIDDVTRIERNAVLLWTIAPSADDEQTAVACLSTA
jgi:hypothetical protein